MRRGPFGVARYEPGLVRVRVPEIPARGENLAQALDVGSIVVWTGLIDALAEPSHRVAQCLGEKLLFAAKVVVDGRRGHPGGPGDVLDSDFHISVAGERPRRGLDDLFTPGRPMSGTLAFCRGHRVSLCIRIA